MASSLISVRTAPPPPLTKTATTAATTTSRRTRTKLVLCFNPAAAATAGRSLELIRSAGTALRCTGNLPWSGRASTFSLLQVQACASVTAAMAASDGSGIMQLNGYLQAARQALLSGTAQCTVVLGNESADLDSMVAAISYAYLLHFLKQKTEDASVAVPVINCPRADFPLRTEAAELFKELKLDTTALVFIDEVELSKVHAAGNLKLVLVDHNKLTSAQEGLASAVVEIVDHHKDEGLYTSAKKNIQQVGSCTTLVAEKVSEEAAEELLFDLDFDKLMLAPILLDTGGLDPSTSRCTPQDEIMAALLVRGAGQLKKEGFYKQLRDLKVDASKLTTEDLLRKDYKQVEANGTHVGVSAVGLKLEEFLKKEPQLEDAMNGFRVKRGCQVLVVMLYHYVNDNFKRELAIVAEDEQVADALASTLKSSEADLQLQPMQVSGLSPAVKTFQQQNLTKSRKVILPMTVDFFSNKR